jgi:hypothetical protein
MPESFNELKKAAVNACYRAIKTGNKADVEEALDYWMSTCFEFIKVTTQEYLDQELDKKDKKNDK